MLEKSRPSAVFPLHPPGPGSLMATTAYRSSPIRRPRRTKAEMDAIREALYDCLVDEHPMSVRQAFYAMTVKGAISKTEKEYKGTVVRLLGDMRRNQEIPYEWLADATRWQRRPTTFSSVESALRRTASTYRRALWDDTPVAVELWLEKEALAGVLVEVTDQWDVPLMVTRGCPSMSFLFSAAESILDRSNNGQETLIYYFGDHDPTGRHRQAGSQRHRGGPRSPGGCVARSRSDRDNQ